MGEILGLGATHFPGLVRPDENMNYTLLRTLKLNDKVPQEMKNPINWPEPMRVEYGEDEGLAAAGRHRERLVNAFRKIRSELDAFNPDVVLIWGDDQYENFKEDIIPPFCVLAYDQIECVPFTDSEGNSKLNVWNEPSDKVFRYPGHPEAARYLVGQLIDQDIDMAYSYKPLHEPGLGHAFINTLLFLDYDRKGFQYPVIPFALNCYGSSVIRNRGGAITQKVNGKEMGADPPGPSPKRCMQVGAAAARAMIDSPWRVALIASSSWSHAFLTAKNHWLWPDLESDRHLFEELRDGNYQSWEKVTTPMIEDAGEQEMLNWMCLAGAMQELDRKPDIVDYIETYVFNSNKCMAVFKP